MGFRADARAAAVTLLNNYATADSVKLQVYPGRPRTLHPPSAFVDGIRETVEHTAQLHQRTATVDVVLIHGTYDSKDTTEQADAFVDGFLSWVNSNVHAAGANTTIGVTEVEDLPTFVSDWMAPADQKTYYATRIGLEGFAG
jgi:hypothetical protein